MNLLNQLQGGKVLQADVDENRIEVLVPYDSQSFTAGSGNYHLQIASADRQAPIDRAGFGSRHDEQLLLANPQRLVNGIERSIQIFLGHGLFQVADCSQSHATAAVLVSGDDMDGNVTSHGIVLQ